MCFGIPAGQHQAVFVSYITWETFLTSGSNALTWWVLHECHVSAAAHEAKGREMRQSLGGGYLQLQVTIFFVSKCVASSSHTSSLLSCSYHFPVFFWQLNAYKKCREALVLLQRGVFLVELLRRHSAPVSLPYPEPLLSCSGMRRKSYRPLQPAL